MPFGIGRAVGQDLIEVDPSSGVQKPLKNVPSRDRFLDNDEIVSFWAACEALGWPWGKVCQLMLLTGQRESEVGGMRWQELDPDKRTWSIPAKRTKNGKAHDVALSDLAFSIIDKGVPRFEAPAGKDFLFSMRGHAAVTSFDHAKLKLNERMALKLPWRLHDLRRTCTTGLARLGIPPHVADKVLNHQSGVIKGVAAVYNRFQYLDERRAALQAWGGCIGR